jgi:hypothetical protein
MIFTGHRFPAPKKATNQHRFPVPNKSQKPQWCTVKYSQTPRMGTPLAMSGSASLFLTSIMKILKPLRAFQIIITVILIIITVNPTGAIVNPSGAIVNST